METGTHILECMVLCDKNDRISYLPTYSDLYSDDVQEQIYISRMIKHNMYTRDVIKEQRAGAGAGALPSAYVN